MSMRWQINLIILIIGIKLFLLYAKANWSRKAVLLSLQTNKAYGVGINFSEVLKFYVISVFRLYCAKHTP
jgi:hypothetical protein